MMATPAVAGLIPDDEDARLAALAEYDVLDTPPEQAFEDLTRLAARICAAPMATITVIDANRQWFKSALGLQAPETPRDGFCSHCILQPDVMTVRDARHDPRLSSHPYVAGDPHIRFYAGVPLVNAQGFALGTLCVIDVVPRDLTDLQSDCLRGLGRQVMAQLELRRLLVRERRRLADLQAVQEVGLRLLAPSARESLATRIASAMCAFGRARRAAVLVYEPESETLRFAGGHGMRHEAQGAALRLDECPVAERALMAGLPCRSSDVDDPDGSLAAALELGPYACVPLRADGTPLGIAVLERPAALDEPLLSLAALAAAGLAPERPALAGTDARSDSAALLSEKELTVLGLVARGLSNPEIGARLYLSRHTVKEYCGNAMRKLGVHSRVEAALAASRLGLIPEQH